MAAISRFSLFEQLRPNAFNFQRGIERETLRVDKQGTLSQKPHPQALGSALTHGSITTDYSESLLEFITGVHTDTQSLLDELSELHCFTSSQLEDEMFWSGSMPSPLPAQEQIPIAQYGDSHIGRLKTIYRHGLWHRYGRKMQTIAGLHYNWSLNDSFWRQWALLNGKSGDLTDFKTDEYFGLIRSFRRHSWLLLYLFGASPAADKSFLDSVSNQLSELNDETLYAPHATSLRMSNVGYSNQAQAELFVCFNSLESYAKTLAEAIRQPYPKYEKIGVKVGEQYNQLSSSILQIENEYYSDIRPKRVAYSGEKQIHALRTRGVEYIEVRCLDVNPYLPLGVDKTQIDFIDLFLLWCMVQDHPTISAEECRQLQKNSELVAIRGRDPELEIVVNGQSRKPAELASELIDSICRFAKNIDQLKQTDDYQNACEAQRSKIATPENLLSSRVLADVKKSGSFRQFTLSRSAETMALLQQPLSEQRLKFRVNESKQSWRRQRDIEMSDQGPFEQFLANYLEQ
ncbi:glutamate--cysteine ligase [Reinekea marinisedimentorum]|uniref:Glutamate--cysteine ligase n=1 Tax=Reinekea marinisedimentorum TaxID=230495 RepID=A0A4R3IDH6_9GAMM|nr:glutamate--cysteine ligase [Reinekea marinisedimentorum]TCS43826.1 glutamate--cysteine ligase [Reinekea marinisedimentorum]